MDIQLNKIKFFHQENVKMSIILDNYCIKPDSYIEGFIILTPILKGDIKLKDPKIFLTLTQYEFFDYINKEKESSKQIENNKQYKEIIFNKEAKIEIENNTISCTLKIPIKVSIPKNDKLLPSFNFKNKDFISGIRHIFTVNIPEIDAINSIGVIFSEINKKEQEDNSQNINIVYKDEQIYKMGLINKGKISYGIRTAKNRYRNDEDINIKIMIDSSSLQEIKIKQLKIKLQRKIIIFGYTINSDFRYTLHEKIFELADKNSNKYELEYSIPKIEENNFTEKEIEQYIHFNDIIIDNNWENKCLTPSMKGYFFSCEYKIKIRTILDSSLINTKKIDMPLQLYFSDDYFNKFKLNFQPEEDVKLGSFILIQNKDEKKKEKKEEVKIEEVKKDNTNNEKKDERVKETNNKNNNENVKNE